MNVACMLQRSCPMCSPPFASAKAGDFFPFPQPISINVFCCQRFLPFSENIFVKNAKNPTKHKSSIGFLILFFYWYDFSHHIQEWNCPYQEYVISLIRTACMHVVAASDKQRNVFTPTQKNPSKHQTTFRGRKSKHNKIDLPNIVFFIWQACYIKIADNLRDTSNYRLCVLQSIRLLRLCVWLFDNSNVKLFCVY